MPKFHQKTKGIINGFEVSMFEVDLGNTDDLSKLESYLKSKIKRMKVHNSEEYFSEYLNNPNINKKFAEALKKRLNEINTPTSNSITWFDVRRSRVTEFMSQLLLEKEYNCIFYDEADKRINVEPVNVDKHTPGIDVTGICNDSDGFKFVACEVKASKDVKIPCNSSEPLLKDIKSGYDNNNERLSREILEYAQHLGKIGNNDVMLANIVEFLIELIKQSSSKEVLINSVIFFPFMVRNNLEICNSLNLNDFSCFNKDEFKGINLKGIIWSFNNDIDTFCSNIYNEVLTNA